MKGIILVALLCVSGTWLFAQKAGDTMYVNVNSGTLKNGTGFFAAKVGTVAYGDPVVVKAISGSNIQVTKGSVTGWIPKSSLTTKKITVASSGSSASAKEIALAGKGFSPSVEDQYKSDEGGAVNYDAVDAMELLVIGDEDLLKFIDEGHLAKGEE